MHDRDALATIDSTLKRIGFKEVGPGWADYEGSLRVHGKPVRVSLSLDDTSFVKRPKVRLLDRSEIPLETLAHIEAEGGICYSSGAGLPLDMYAPGPAVLRILDEVRRTLELSYRGRAIGEVVDEYQSYWYPKLGVRTLLARTATVDTHQASMFFALLGKDVQFIGLNAAGALPGYNIQNYSEAVIWHLNERLGPGAGIRAPDTLDELERWFAAQQAFKDRHWADAFSVLASEAALFFSAPNALLGVRLEFPKAIAAGLRKGSIRQKAIPLIIKSMRSTVEIARYAGVWCGLSEVTARNLGGGANLSEKSVALVGCGTIGSHLAKMLVQSGAGCSFPLEIVDPDILSQGNIGRHLLGFRDIGKSKATALKAELERFHPDVKIIAHSENALQIWPRLAGCDLFIDATGEWNVQVALNERFLRDAKRPNAMLHSMIFMNGAGVQSFLNLGDEFACFRCLKPIFDQPWRYPAGRDDDELNLQAARCGDGSFIPFSVDVAATAASIANRAALDWATGHPGARLRSAITDIDRGRFQKPISPTRSPHCPACSVTRGGT